METFAERLIKARNNAGLSQRQLANELNISVQTYNGYETKGYEPRYDLLLKICYVLNVTPNELLGYADSDKLKTAKAIANFGRILYKQAGNKIVISGSIGNYPEQIDIVLTKEEFTILIFNSLSMAESSMRLPKKRIIHDEFYNQLYRFYADILRYKEDMPVFSSTNCRVLRYDMNGFDILDD